MLTEIPTENTELSELRIYTYTTNNNYMKTCPLVTVKTNDQKVVQNQMKKYNIIML